MINLYTVKVLFIILITFLVIVASSAATVNVAVASNALVAVKYLKSDFEKTHSHKVNISSGSTGKLYAQIIHGAPFDIFMAANEREPALLEKNDYVVKGTRFTYAIGRIVLFYSKSMDNLFSGLSFEKNLSKLTTIKFKRISIASPKTAPYGAAAKQALEAAQQWHKIKKRLITGENINQALQYVVSGNADVGIVALSQVKQYVSQGYSYTVLAGNTYSPINQQMVLLRHASNKQAARQFYDYLKSPEVARILKTKFGYKR